MDLSMYVELFDHSPIGMSICDVSGQCVAVNRAMCDMVGATREQILAQNLNRLDSWKRSGLAKIANDAIAAKGPARVRTTLTTTFGKELVAQIRFTPFSSDDKEYLLCTFDDLADLKKAEDEREKLIHELRTTLDEVKALRGILPLCSYCKKVRDDKGYWEQVDVYISKHLFADISHSICPDCIKKHYPDVYDQLLIKKKAP